MLFESILTVIPAVAAVGAAVVAVFLGYAAASCSVARMQGKECPDA